MEHAEQVEAAARAHDPSASVGYEGNDLVVRAQGRELRVLFLGRGSFTLRLTGRGEARWSLVSRSTWFPEKLGPKASVPALEGKYKVFGDAAAVAGAAAELNAISTEEHFRARSDAGAVTLTWSLLRKPVLAERVRAMLRLGTLLSR